MLDGLRTGITVFAGRFGSGKTEAALNYALVLARDSRIRTNGFSHGALARDPRLDLGASEAVLLVDLDLVTPYFRSRDTADLMPNRGVRVVAPSIIGQYLDSPAITAEILGALQQQELPVVLDVGGDPQGARALGQYSSAIRQRAYHMHFVVNPYRPFTNTLEGLASSISEIERNARLQVTSLVSNPNLINETTVELITEGHARIEAWAQELNLPVAFVCVERHWLATLGISPTCPGISASNHFGQPVLAVDRLFVMSWE